MRNIILYTILFLLCAPHVHAQFGSVDIDPRAYKSKNGKYELFVNPLNRYGAEPGDYRLSFNGKELWKKELSFTFVNVVVANDGSFAGYGLAGGNFGVAPTDLIVAIIERNGAIRREERTAQTLGSGPYVLPNPRAEKIVLDEANDRFIVTIRDADFQRQANTWWIYQLSTGKRTGAFQPKVLMERSEDILNELAINPIDATPLILIQWNSKIPKNSMRAPGAEEGPIGTRFTLVNLQFKPVWMLDWPKDLATLYEYDGHGRLLFSYDEHGRPGLPRGEVYKNGTVLRTNEPLRFTLVQIETLKAITFEVTKDEKTAAGWNVREISSEYYKFPSREQKSNLAENPARNLTYLGSIQLDHSRALKQTDTINTTSPQLEKIRTLEIDRHDQIYAVDKQSGAIHIFDSDGRPKQICKLDAGDMKKTVMDQSLMITDAGDTFVQVSNESSNPVKFIQFDAKGRRVGEKSLTLGSIAQKWFSKPNDEGFWVVGYREIFLLDNNWNIIHKIERNRDNGWLKPIDGVRCAPDGALAVHDGKMHIFESDGRPRTLFPTPKLEFSIARLFSPYPFAFDGTRFIIIKKSLAIAFDTEGNCLFEFDPPEMYDIYGAYLTKNGNELLLFDGRFTLYRYGMLPAVEPVTGK